jgi:NAD(P)-dependent dehydrogenase (short-subunit alcohol dehydrogenase family)
MNPTALITGASRGLGRGIALELAGLGWDLLLNYARDEEAAAATAADCRAAARVRGREIRVVTVRADIARAGDRAALVARARTEFPRLDLLVNNAGVAPAVRADLLEVGEESFDRLLAINLKGPFFLTQQIARWMMETPAGGPTPAGEDGEDAAGPARRAIVFVTSISAYTASVNRGEYCVSKAGLAMVVKLFAARLAEAGIGVFEIRPGIMATDMTAPVRARYDALIAEGLTPIRRWGTPADVGRAVAAIALGLLPFSTGEVINVDGGFHLRRL